MSRRPHPTEIASIVDGLTFSKMYRDCPSAFEHYLQYTRENIEAVSSAKLFLLDNTGQMTEGTLNVSTVSDDVVMRYLAITFPSGIVILCTDNGHVPAIFIYWSYAVSNVDMYDALCWSTGLGKVLLTGLSAKDIPGNTSTVIAHRRFDILEVMAHSRVEPGDIPENLDLEYPVYVVFHAGSHSDFTILPAPKETK